MAKTYVKRSDADGVNTIAFNKPATISAEYVRLNAQLHHDNLMYGVGGGKHAPVVLKLAESLKSTSVLDYGCGKGMLAKELPYPIWEYDPAIPTKAEPPRPADLVVCTDVLELIEPDRLAFVLADLRRCVRKLGYFVIHTKAAGKTLPDGRNTHLIQRGEAWWRKNLAKFFTVGKILTSGPLLHVIVTPKVAHQSASAIAAQMLEAAHV
jgi:2-polyprenyl-3-methyl-5-hydroxy-6-metoxy-1,4-benzoquinol methylase